MRAIHALRTAPVRLAARLQDGESDAGMTTAEYAVGTSVTAVLRLWEGG